MANMDWAVIIKNTSGSTVVLEDLGFEIGNGAQVTLSDFFTYGEISDSTDLQREVLDGHLVVNNGSIDLTTPQDGVNYIIRDNIYRDMQTHYTKAELANINGGGTVDWSNITNAPSFGSPAWVEPVVYRVTAISASAPPTPAEGDVYIKTLDQHYYKRVGAAWVDQGSASTDDRVINLSDSTQDIYTFDGAAWVDSGVATDNTATMVNDNGDGKNAQYVYSTESSTWIKIADVDFENHLDGGDNKHDASEIDVEGTYFGAPADLETVIGNIYNDMVEAIDNNTLDMAYDQGGPGIGRVITVDSGAVKLDTGGTATNAPLEIVPKASLPSTDLQPGQLAVKDGILCIYDSARTQWLSVQRQFLVFGRSGATRNQYLNFGVGSLPSNNAGYRMARNATIISISGQLDAPAGSGVNSCDLNIRLNDTATTLVGLNIASSSGNQIILSGLTGNINAGDFVQAYCSAAGASVQDPVMIVEIAWRP